jgi:hypothetical protein
MHWLDGATRTFACIALMCIALYVAYAFLSCALGKPASRQRARRKFWPLLRTRGLAMLGVTLKMIALLGPRANHRVSWLWIPPLAVGVFTWLNKGPRPVAVVETPYTRSLRLMRQPKRKLNNFGSYSRMARRRTAQRARQSER